MMPTGKWAYLKVKIGAISDGAAGGGKIMLEADKLNENAALIDGQYHVARPITLPFTWRFRGAWEVLMGRAEAVVFYKQ